MPENDPKRFAADGTPRDDAETTAGGRTAGGVDGDIGSGVDRNTEETIVAPKCEIRVGPAGWSYPDWSGYVYPSPRPKGFHEATYLAEFFDTIEINTSFYSPLQPGHAHQWLERVAANPRFLFTAKLWQKFTHETSFETADDINLPLPGNINSPLPGNIKPPSPGGHTPIPVRSGSSALRRAGSSSSGEPSAEDERIVRAGFDVLRNAGKLGAVLLQFPFSFHRTSKTTTYLAALLKRFADYPLAVEMRHASWNDAEVFALLGEYHTTFCNIDQPIIGRSLGPFDTQGIGPKQESMSPIGYIRLHGRRYDTWFSDDPTVPSHERYNYLYSAEELAPWAARAQTAAEHTRNVFAVTNNHYLGKGVVNALQLISMLKGAKVNVPEPLRQHYPELEKIASMPPERPTLFPMGKRE